MPAFSKVMVIGNVAGGKTRLSRQLAERYQLPLTHVDSIQFLPGLQIRPIPEARQMIQKVESGPAWIIDGYGPYDLIENRFVIADRIVFIDLPVWRHLWWLVRRQIQSLWKPREELPEKSREFTWEHSRKLWRTFWGMHRQMRPQLIRILQKEEMSRKVIWIRQMSDWNRVSRHGIDL